MDKKRKYIIISNSFLFNIEKKVCEKMEEGYIPYGDLTVITDDNNSHTMFKYCQPMILKEENEQNTTN